MLRSIFQLTQEKRTCKLSDLLPSETRALSIIARLLCTIVSIFEKSAAICNNVSLFFFKLTHFNLIYLTWKLYITTINKKTNITSHNWKTARKIKAMRWYSYISAKYYLLLRSLSLHIVLCLLKWKFWNTKKENYLVSNWNFLLCIIRRIEMGLENE